MDMQQRESGVLVPADLPKPEGKSRGPRGLLED